MGGQQGYPQDVRPQQPGYGSQPGYGGYNQPTEAYPVGGQGTPSRYEQPTEAYPQAGYGQGQMPPQDYYPQGGYPQQYGQTIPPQQPPVNVNAKKKGVPLWAWLVPLLIVLAVGGGLITWSVLQSQENERRAQAAATATAQSQATATAVKAEANRRGTSTAVAQKTATAVTAAENKNKTATAQARATGTAQAQATSQALETANAQSTATTVAAVTATALAAQAQMQTATALAQIPVNPTATSGGVITGVQGQIQSVTVDYDVFQGDDNAKGMLIHVKFTVDGLKDAKCQATAYFYYDNNQPVKDTDGQLNTVDGQVAISEPFNPGFDSTIYDDFQLFMPYDQFDLGPGSYNLRFQVQTYVLSPYQLIAVSDYVDFAFSK